MQNSKCLSICLLIASVILSAAVVFHAKASAPISPIAPTGRYQFHPSSPPGVLWIIDTTTGEIRGKNGSAILEPERF